MAHIIEDRIAETATTTGTGDFTVAGAIVGFKAFSTVMAVSDTCYYMIEGVDGSGIPTGEWETGLGTYSAANTVTRTVVDRSSNSNAAVSFSAGTKRVAIATTRRSTGRGTAFPTSPYNGERFYRTDRKIEYDYDLANTQWLSAQHHYAIFTQPNALTAITTSNDAAMVNPGWNEYDIYVETGRVISNLSTTTAANYHTHQFRTYDAGTPTNLGSSLSTQNDLINTYVGHSVTINTVVASTIEGLDWQWVRVGTGTAFVAATLRYRLVG